MSGLSAAIGWFALVFGISAPVWVIAVPSERCWVGWFLIGCVAFGWIFFFDFSRGAGSTPGAPLGAAIIALAGLCFLVSMAARGMFIVMYRPRNEDSSRISER